MSLIKKFLFGKRISPPFVRLLVFSVILLFISSLAYYLIKVDGYSMSPTFKEGDVLFVDRDVYTNENPKRNDIIVFRHSKEEVIKRIIGLPGETVLIRDGEILINSKRIKRNFGVGLAGGKGIGAGPYKLSKGCYFVIGDNREDTFWGVIRRKDIIGKVIL